MTESVNAASQASTSLRPSQRTDTVADKGSGAAVDMTVAQVWTIRDGKFSQMQIDADPAEALAAVGLPEETRRAVLRRAATG